MFVNRLLYVFHLATTEARPKVYYLPTSSGIGSVGKGLG